MRAIGLHVLVLGIALALPGCTTTQQYPSDWAAPTAVEAGRCPSLVGRFINIGLAAQKACFSTRARLAYRWDCDVALSANILSADGNQQSKGSEVRWLELEQPDDDTLVIRHEHALTPVVLRRSAGDFSCGESALTISSTGSTVRTKSMGPGSTAFLTTFGAFVGSTGLSTLSRHFRRLSDGSLLMEVGESMVGTHLFIPVVFASQYYVRWPHADAAE